VLAEFGSVLNGRQLDALLKGDEQAEVKTDESLLRMMISNLIDNAIKYTPTGGRIEVVVSSGPEECRLSISDNGPGIPADQREAVFQRFFRLDTLHTEGAGLGLAIVADIVDRLAATIELTTPSWGKGLRINLDLPREQTA
jgi:two-component system OmpR family sensor kinase/two-component system sensor histidine kinase QseC